MRTPLPHPPPRLVSCESALPPGVAAFSSRLALAMWSALPLLLTLALVAWCRGGAAPCSSSLSAAAYRVQLKTAWTRESFPQHYPEWRPPAQWSPLVGRSHDSSFVLFRVGLIASAGLKLFAETGRDEGLDGSQGDGGGVLDAFRATAIPAGAGSTTTAFFVDGNHTKVSVIARLVPSPDWFVGLDSIELCSGEHWLPSLTVDGHVLDAGTDNGLTFTAPKWATHPQGLVLPLESALLPPGASFHYPHVEQLPPIATFHFTKVREYRVVAEQKSELIPDQQLDGLKTALKQSTNESVNSVFRSLPSVSPQLLLPRGDKDAIVNSIVDKYRRRDGRKLVQRPTATKPRRPPRDCRVSHWAAWGPCSKTCGIGETRRARQVVKPARRGGSPCPLLHQSKWCAAEPCAAFFRWSST